MGERREGRVDKYPYFIIWEWLDAAPFGFGWTGGGDARSRDGATSEDVRQDGGALDIFDQQGNHGAQFRLAQRVTQRARPVNVVDGRVRVLNERKKGRTK